MRSASAQTLGLPSAGEEEAPEEEETPVATEGRAEGDAAGQPNGHVGGHAASARAVEQGGSLRPSQALQEGIPSAELPPVRARTPKEAEESLRRQVHAALRTHEGWLLIVDNVDEPAAISNDGLLKRCLPPASCRGHVLITSILGEQVRFTTRPFAHMWCSPKAPTISLTGAW